MYKYNHNLKESKKIVLAIGGSSGSIYALRLMTKLREAISSYNIGIVMTDNAKLNWEIELGKFNQANWPFNFYDKSDFNAPFASGSAKYETMIICPSSMGLLGRIANGISDDLITRAADVVLKERRKLIIVPRETPYNLIHLRNMTSLTEAGAIICPATPSFYNQPQTLEQIADTVVDRVLDLAGVNINTFRWGEPK
ncbi:MAG: UbiX family flavin prenyltransferase [Saprospiraceae bacterium]|nr:UbiX family flavin prenyltransferase [Saprospiraceae bacterium]